MNFKVYHFHLYYQVADIEKAREVLDEVKNNFDLRIGHAHDKPVGPHPIGSCQITATDKEFHALSDWLLKNRRGFDVFIHAVTGNDLIDHTEYVMWIGREHPLKLDIFR